MDKAILEKMGGLYLNYTSGQQYVIQTLVAALRLGENNPTICL